MECKHLNSEIRGDDPWGKVFCPDCGKLIWITDFMKAILAEAKAVSAPEPQGKAIERAMRAK